MKRFSLIYLLLIAMGLFLAADSIVPRRDERWVTFAMGIFLALLAVVIFVTDARTGRTGDQAKPGGVAAPGTRDQ